MNEDKKACVESARSTELLVGWLGFYGLSTFVGYLTPNPFLYK